MCRVRDDDTKQDGSENKDTRDDGEEHHGCCLAKIVVERLNDKDLEGVGRLVRVKREFLCQEGNCVQIVESPVTWMSAGNSCTGVQLLQPDVKLFTKPL